MNILTLILVCSYSVLCFTVPFQRRRRDLIIMPGVKASILPKDTVAHPKANNTMLSIENSEPVDNIYPIIFGNRKSIIPDGENEVTTVNSQVSDESVTDSVFVLESEVPKVIFFPKEDGSFNASKKATGTLLNQETVKNQTSGGNGDVFLFPGSTRVELDTPFDKESAGPLECHAISGAININGTCLRYLARNKCRVGEWFVKNQGEETGGSCATRPCPMGELLFKDRCISASDETACQDGQMLYVDFSGYVHCDCQPNFVYDPWSGHCYAQGDQGYCNVGEQLLVEENGAVTCKVNLCFVNGFVYHNASGKCYRKMYAGFCDDGLLITHENNRTAECSAIATHSIFDLPTLRSCTGGSVRDYAGACREEFRVPTVSTYPVTYGECPLGFSKDKLGSCRKTNRLFG